MAYEYGAKEPEKLKIKDMAPREKELLIEITNIKKIMGLDKAYKEIFSSKNLHENLSKINGEYKDNELVGEVIKFIEKDKKRPICSPEN